MFSIYYKAFVPELRKHLEKMFLVTYSKQVGHVQLTGRCHENHQSLGLEPFVHGPVQGKDFLHRNAKRWLQIRIPEDFRSNCREIMYLSKLRWDIIFVTKALAKFSWLWIHLSAYMKICLPRSLISRRLLYILEMDNFKVIRGNISLEILKKN